MMQVVLFPTKPILGKELSLLLNYRNMQDDMNAGENLPVYDALILFYFLRAEYYNLLFSYY